MLIIFVHKSISPFSKKDSRRNYGNLKANSREFLDLGIHRKEQMMKPGRRDSQERTDDETGLMDSQERTDDKTGERDSQKRTDDETE